MRGEFHVHVFLERIGRSGEIDLNTVIDDEVDGHEGLDQLGIAAQFFYRGTHRREIDEERDAGEVLEDDSSDGEGDFDLGGRFRVPIGEVFDVFLADFDPVAVAQNGFEHDADRNGQARNIWEGILEGWQRVEFAFGPIAGRESAEGVSHREMDCSKGVVRLKRIRDSLSATG